MPRLVVFVALAFVYSLYAQSTRLEFEVASIKPSPPPDGRGRTVGCIGGPGNGDPGLLTCRNMNLANLVSTAYKLSYYQLSAPDWMKDPFATFDLSARVPEGATRDDLNTMMQNLLADRFKLVVHRESREIQQYDLVVAKNGPKFKEAPPPAPQPDAAGDAKKGPAAPVKLGDDGYPVIPGGAGGAFMQGRARIYFPQMTMQLLAGQLSGQLGKPVTDATGLKGKYAIGMFWSTDDAARAAAPGPGGVPVASDPAPTLMEALQDQLGLRLESKKGWVEFVVVDHAEKTPTEN
jgi:uncharacterized protein (TIGR03435 family)